MPRSPPYDPWQLWVSRDQVAGLLGKAPVTAAVRLFTLEAFEDVLDVLAYGVLRYAELAGDLPARQTGCDDVK